MLCFLNRDILIYRRLLQGDEKDQREKFTGE